MSICEVTASLLLSAAPAVSPGRLRDLGVTCVVNAACELPDTPLPYDRQVAYFKVCVEDRPNADLLSHMDFVVDMIEEVSSGAVWDPRMSWIQLAQDRVQWRTLVLAVLNIQCR
jgi:hypothetical protein